MPTIINKTTHEVRDVSIETDYSTEEWLICTRQWLDDHDGLPEFPRSLWRYQDGNIIQGEPLPPPPEPILVRHAREQQEGVTLSNGWKIKYGKSDRDELGALKNTIDLVGSELSAMNQTVPIFEANGTAHFLSPEDMLIVLKEYTMLALIEYNRQALELAN